MADLQSALLAGRALDRRGLKQLTRFVVGRTLLRRKIVMHGYLLDSQDPEEQAREVIELYGLSEQTSPLGRCLPCNGILVPVAKEEIIDRLEPLTKKYYHDFHICPDCDRIYWAGSHQQKLVAAIDRILGK